MGRKTILISNDDGIRAKGLKVLTEIARQFGEVLVVAPHTSRSGMSKAITVDQPLRLYSYKNYEGARLYCCTGTPVDCIKLAFDKLLDSAPDLVLSGINHGANSSVSVHYSGTMGAVIEGCIHQVPSLGFSLCDYHPDADFSAGVPFISNLIEKVLNEGLPSGTCLNVNIPKGNIAGVEACRQGHGRWVEEFDQRKDPHNVDYYWITGYYENMDNGMDDTDNHFLSDHKISVVPIKIDMTDHGFLSTMKKWRFVND